MAERPVFAPAAGSIELVREVWLTFKWNPGLAPSQKKKNIVALHEAAANEEGLSPLLEISTKSPEELGRRLSAFNLRVESVRFGGMSLESAFQGSKVFERGGPFIDLYAKSPREARSDHRLHDSGKLREFKFENTIFRLEPKTMFYDWLYLKAVRSHIKDLMPLLQDYAGFTDIEFNPERSINCQARSCALVVSMLRLGQFDEIAATAGAFIGFLSKHQYGPECRAEFPLNVPKP